MHETRHAPVEVVPPDGALAPRQPVIRAARIGHGHAEQERRKLQRDEERGEPLDHVVRVRADVEHVLRAGLPLVAAAVAQLPAGVVQQRHAHDHGRHEEQEQPVQSHHRLRERGHEVEQRRRDGVEQQPADAEPPLR